MRAAELPHLCSEGCTPYDGVAGKLPDDRASGLLTGVEPGVGVVLVIYDVTALRVDRYGE